MKTPADLAGLPPVENAQQWAAALWRMADDAAAAGEKAQAGRRAAGDAWADKIHADTGKRPTIAERVKFNTGHPRREAREAVRGIHAAALRAGDRPIDSAMPDPAIRARADSRAMTLRADLDGMTETDPQVIAAWLLQRTAGLGGALQTWAGYTKGAAMPAEWLAPALARARCPIWWRRQLRREVVRLREVEAMQAGEVGIKGRTIGPKRRRTVQVYCTDDTVARRAARMAANAAMLEATKIENEAGETITLAQASAAGTANKGIRRAELMTRIDGCDRWARAAGFVGIFTTNTAPSRYHAQTIKHGKNPRHDGSTPRQAQAWLRATWARCRARLQRLGLRFFGFRVAEPHHDGCPHWHMLVWCHADDCAALQSIIRGEWLAEEMAAARDAMGDDVAGPPDPDAIEPGARAHRFKGKELDAGGAAAYCAKYVAKGIDDAGAVGTEGHTEDAGAEGAAVALPNAKACRVEAWAAAWGIRQFQALGQPPVTVWRELRRVDAQHIKGAAPAVVAAHAAVNRAGSSKACWSAYMTAQGGAMTGRAYGIRIERSEDMPEPGKYGDARAPAIIGVVHVSRPDELIVSGRKEWKAAGTWAAAIGHRAEPRIEGLDGVLGPVNFPRTRVNNCTAAPQGDRQKAAAVLRMAAETARLNDRSGYGPMRYRFTHPPAQAGTT